MHGDYIVLRPLGESAEHAVHGVKLGKTYKREKCEEIWEVALPTQIFSGYLIATQLNNRVMRMG